jgi:retron-type reverse transcriptase
MMNEPGKTDRLVVPKKSPNKAGQLAEEEMEGSGLAKGNLLQQNASRTPSRKDAPHALERVRQAAQKDKKLRFTALLHHVYNLETLRMAYFGLKKEAAPGVDGETWQHYGEALESNLQDLSHRLRRGAYRAKPVRRVYIPKADGRRRPLGVTALEDKIVQRATVEVLNAIYETDFLGFSYGFRPGRNQHQALDALYTGLLTRKVHWVLDLDIKSFFDGISHEWLIQFIEHRIADRRVVRLIQKWLKAGVLDEGRRMRVDEGTPQGGSAAPLTQKVISSLKEQLRVGKKDTHCLIYVVNSNIFMSNDTLDQRAESSAAERCSWSITASSCAARCCATLVAQVRFIKASSISLSGGGLSVGSAGRDDRGHCTDHVEASATHSGTVTEICAKQWLDHRNHRDQRFEFVSRHSQETWLSRGQMATRVKSVSNISLTACSSPNSLRPTIFWCPAASAQLAGV